MSLRRALGRLNHLVALHRTKTADLTSVDPTGSTTGSSAGSSSIAPPDGASASSRPTRPRPRQPMPPRRPHPRPQPHEPPTRPRPPQPLRRPPPNRDRRPRQLRLSAIARHLGASTDRQAPTGLASAACPRHRPALDGCLMSLRRALGRLNDFVALDRTKTADLVSRSPSVGSRPRARLREPQPAPRASPSTSAAGASRFGLALDRDPMNLRRALGRLSLIGFGPHSSWGSIPRPPASSASVTDSSSRSASPDSPSTSAASPVDSVTDSAESTSTTSASSPLRHRFSSSASAASATDCSASSSATLAAATRLSWIQQPPAP